MLGPQLEFVGATEVNWEGERYTFFGGNDYHRLSRHPDVVNALHDAADRYGLNSAGSRSTTANHPLYLALEAKVAEYLGVEKAVIFSAGYLSNTILLQAVVGDYTHFLMDEIAHASLVEAAIQTGLPILRFQHLDADDLGRLAAGLQPSDKPLVLTDGVFPSSGEIPPLANYLDVLPAAAKLLIDDAHGLGVVGQTGKGSWEEEGIPRHRIFQTGTLSKGLGGFGGIVAGSADLVEKIIARSPAFTGSTPMPLPTAAAALAAISILQRHSEKVHLLQARALVLKGRLGEIGFRCSQGPAPICSVTFLDAAKNRVLFEALKQARIYPVFITYPGCPPGGHFRFTLSSAHSDDEIERLYSTVTACARSLRR